MLLEGQKTNYSSSSQRRRLLGVIGNLIGDYPKQFIALLAVVALQSLVTGLTTIFVATIVDFVFSKSTVSTSSITNKILSFASDWGIELGVGRLFLIFGTLLLVSGLIGVVSRFLILKIKYDVLRDLLGRTMHQFLNSSYKFFSTGEVGKLLNSFQKEVEKVGDTFGLTVTAIVGIFQALVYLSIPIWLYPMLAWKFFWVGGILVLPLLFLRGLANGLGQKTTNTANSMAKILHENLTSAKLIISFGRQEHSTTQYKNAFTRHAVAAIRFATLVSGVNLLFVPLGSIAALVVIYQSYKGGQNISELAVLLFAFFRALPLLASALQAKTSIEGFLPAYNQVEQLRQQAVDLQVTGGRTPFVSLGAGIRFQGVAYKYSKDVTALSGIDFFVDTGSVTAFIGKSGSGKTTALDLLMGLYRPTEGVISVNDWSLDNFDYSSYREQIGYVPQDPQLFNASIRENLIWGSPSATDSEIGDACGLANAQEFVSKLPGRLEYVVGDRGGRLSGGQRQKIALARALLRQPELLVLDEVTSSLDRESEMHIRKAIQNLKGKVTVVIVAHRLETISIADQIFVFDNGHIVESGSYNELSGKDYGYLKS